MADRNEPKGKGAGKGSPGKKKSPTKPNPLQEPGTEEVKREEVVKKPEVTTPIKNEETPLKEKVMNVEDTDDGETKEDGEGAVGGESWSGWFTSTINSAKEKSNEMLQYLKQDLSEFSETVSEAGRDLKDKLKLEESAKQAAKVVGENMNVVLEQMSTIFGVGPDDEDEETVVVGKSGRLVVDRVQAKIYSLALDESVFTSDPEDMNAYEKWLAHFDLELKNDEIADLLTANPHLQLHYSQLVPDKVSHLVFWHRFYYRVQLIFDEEEKQTANEKKQEKSRQSSPKKASGNSATVQEEDSLGSDMMGAGDQNVVEISEEDQKRLLAEYEEELKHGGGEESGKHSRQSSNGNQMSSSSSGSFAFVTRDPETNELKVE